MRPDTSEATARAILNRYIQALRVDFAGSGEAVILIGSLATGGYVPAPATSTRSRYSGRSFEVSPEVARTLTAWCKRYLQWGADHEPDEVPGASVAASKPEDDARLSW